MYEAKRLAELARGASTRGAGDSRAIAAPVFGGDEEVGREAEEGSNRELVGEDSDLRAQRRQQQQRPIALAGFDYPL